MKDSIKYLIGGILWIVGGFALILLLAILSNGCSKTEDEITAKSICRDQCAQYQECKMADFAASYISLADCRAKCEQQMEQEKNAQGAGSDKCLNAMWRLSPATNRPALSVNGKRNEG